MSKQIFFFLLPEDIKYVLNNIHEKYDLQYLKTGSFTEEEVKRKKYIFNLDDIGYSISGNHQSGGILLLPQDITVEFRKKFLNNGEKRFFIDQEKNIESIVLWAGGKYKQNILVCGHIATIHENDFCRNIINDFQKVIKKHSKKCGRYYIGKSAYINKMNFRFVTMDEYEPEEYDLIVE